MGVVIVESVQSDGQDNDDNQQDDSDTSGLITLPGMYLSQCLIAINILCFALLMTRFYISSRKSLHSHPVSNLLKLYTQKLSLMNILLGLIAFLLAYWLTSFVAVKEEVKSKCFTMSDSKYMLLFILIYSIGICYIRYIAVGLASSELPDAAGGDSGQSGLRPGTKPDVYVGFNSQQSPIFLTTLKIYVLVAAISFFTAIFTLFGPIPELLQTFLFEWSFCVPSQVVSAWYRFTVVCCVTLLFNVTIVVTEKALRQPKASDTRGVIYLTPFTATTAGTSFSCWIFLLAFMVFWLNFCTMQIVLVWSLCSSLDAVWSLILGLSIPTAVSVGSGRV